MLHERVAPAGTGWRRSCGHGAASWQFSTVAGTAKALDATPAQPAVAAERGAPATVSAARKTPPHRAAALASTSAKGARMAAPAGARRFDQKPAFG